MSQKKKKKNHRLSFLLPDRNSTLRLFSFLFNGIRVAHLVLKWRQSWSYITRWNSTRSAANLIASSTLDGGDGGGGGGGVARFPEIRVEWPASSPRSCTCWIGTSIVALPPLPFPLPFTLSLSLSVSQQMNARAKKGRID